MRRIFLPALLRIFLVAGAAAGPLAAANLKEATVTQAYNIVKIVAPSRDDRPASAGDRINGEQGLRTGQASRAELEFIDRTLTRLGANTVFTFENGTREMQLDQGTMLLQVPKGAGGAKIRTAAITAAITGTTILLEYSPKFVPKAGSAKPPRRGYVKVIVLEGTLRLYLNNRVGESVLVKAGQMLITSPDTLQLPDSVDIDISKLVDTSLLVNNRYWQGNDTATRQGGLSMGLIDSQIAKQRGLIAQGKLVETNLGITGRGTLVMIQSNDPQSQINTRTTAAQSQVVGTPPVAPTNPGDFIVGSGTTIATNPPKQSGSTHATGVVYHGASVNGPFSVFGLAPPRAFDATAGFAGSFFGGGSFPTAGVAVFRYGGTLTLTGSIEFVLGGGRTTVALIANAGILTSPDEFNFSLGSLTELLLATADGSITIGSGVSITGDNTRLDLYARGANSDLTVNGYMNLGAGKLYGAAERDIILYASIYSGSTELISGRSIQLNGFIETGAFTASAGQDFTLDGKSRVVAAGPVNFSATRNLTLGGRIDADVISLQAGNNLVFGGTNFSAGELTSLTVQAGHIVLTSNLTLGASVLASLTASNGIEAPDRDIAGAQLTINLTGGTLVAASVQAQALTLANATVNAALNVGTLNATAGTVILNGGGSGSGAYTIASGATLDFAGGIFVIDAPGSISGAGNVRFSAGSVTLGGPYNIGGATSIAGGSIDFNGAANLAALNFSSGTLGGSGAVQVGGPFAWTGGTMNGSGTTTVTGALTISGPAGVTLGGNRGFFANGTTNLGGVGLTFETGNGTPSFTNNGSFTAGDDADLLVTGTGTIPVFTNGEGATFTKAGADTTTTVATAFSNFGTVNVNAGTLNFTNTYTQSAGTLALLGGTVQTAGFLNLQGGLLTGAGSILGSVTSAAVIMPSLSGSGLSISGDLSLLSNSQLTFQLGGLVAGSQYGTISVGGRVSLGGTLVVSFVNGFENSITNGNTFTLITTTAFAGAFANVVSGSRLLTSDGSGSFLVTYSGTTLTLSNFISGAANFATWTGGTGNWSNAAQWTSNPLFPNNGNGGFVFVATINSGNVTQDVTGGVIIEQLVMNGGTLFLQNPLRLNAGLQYAGGTLTNGTLTLGGTSNQAGTMAETNLGIVNGGVYNLNFDGTAFSGGGGSFTNTGTLAKASGSGLTLFNLPLSNSGTVIAQSGVLRINTNGTSTGTIAAAAGAAVEFSAGYSFASGSIFSGAGEIRLNNNTDTTIAGNITNSGTLVVNTAGNVTRLLLGSNVQLSGGGIVRLTGGNAQIAGGNTLTNVNNSIQGVGNLGANAVSFVNQSAGVVNANVNGGVLFLDPSTGGFLNQGLMEATNGGILQFTGNAGGGFTNTGGTILADGAGSEVQFVNGVGVTGGTFNTINGGVIRTVGGQTVFISNVTNAGTFTLSNNSDTYFSGTLTNNGNVLVQTAGNVTRFMLQTDLTLNGGGTVTLTGGNSQIGGSFTLTNVDNTIQGFGNIGANAAALINQAAGVINANSAGNILFLDPSVGGFVNNGQFEATNGGILQLSGNAGGGFTNNATILANGSGSEVQLLTNGSVTGGTFSTLNGGIIRVVGGNLAFISDLTNAANFIVSNNADLLTSGTINNQATFTLATAGNVTRILLNADTTFTGGGSIILGGANAQISGGFLLTNFNNVVQGVGNIGANSARFLNQTGGVVNANVTGQVLFVDPPAVANAFVNQGLLEATNGGILQLSGNAGGGFVNNALILADGNGSEVQLLTNADVNGGTFNTANGGIIRVNGGQLAAFTSVTNAGSLVVSNNADLYLTTTFTNQGTVTLDSAGNNTRLMINGAVTLNGGGTIVMQGTTAQIANNGTLTNVDNLIQGRGNIGANSLVFLNMSGGVVNANVTGQVLFLDPANSAGAFTNNGLFEATNGGILQLSGNAGGDFVNNGTILANGTGSQVQMLTNSSISGGVLQTLDGGVIRENSGQTGYLTNVTLNGNLMVDNNADLYLIGTFTNQGFVTLNSAGNSTRLMLDSSLTLTGGGFIIMQGPTALIGGSSTLTNLNNQILGQGNIGSNSIIVLNRPDGVINANIAGQILFLDPANQPGAFTNQGLLEATNGGFLRLSGSGGGDFLNTGAVILADGSGSEVQFLNSSSVTGGTLRTRNGGLLRVLAGETAYFSGVTFDGNLSGENNSDTRLSGAITNLGSITLNSAGNSTRLLIDTNVTLSGGGTVTLAGPTAQIGGANTLTNVDNLFQGQGNIGVNGMAFVNQAAGVINANVTGGVLTLDPPNIAGAFINQGLLEATNGGILQFSGSGGGGFTNTGALILATGTGSEIRFVSNAAITGGTLRAINEGILHLVGGDSVTFNSLTIDGDYLADNNSDTHLGGTITNLGTMTINSGGNTTRLLLDTDVTLTGGGTLTLAGPTAQIGIANTLTNVNNLIQGQGNIGGNGMGVLNQAAGVINANVTGGVLTLDPPNAAGSFVNQGLLLASNGGFLRLSGNGGGDFDNSAGQIVADGVGSEVQFTSNARVNGGLLTGVNGGGFRVLSGQSAYLAGVNLAGSLLVENNSDLHLSGNISNQGSILIASGGNTTRLLLDADTTLSGGGFVNLSGVSQITGAFTLTNVNNTIDGYGNIGTNSTSIVNQAGGVIHANFGGQTLVIDPPNVAGSFVNAGTLEASFGGTLQLSGNGGGSFTSSGTIRVNDAASTVRFDGNVTSSGTVDVGSGTLTGTGTYTQTPTGIFQIAGGTAQSNNTMNFQGGVLAGYGTINANITSAATIVPTLGNTGLAITGNVGLLSGSQLSFQLGGLTQGSQFSFISVNGSVTLGGSLVISFANGFQNSVTGSNTFTLLTTSGVLSGAFANIASGSRLSTSDSFGSFVVTYNGNTIILSDYVANGPRPARLATKADPSLTGNGAGPVASGGAPVDPGTSKVARVLPNGRVLAGAPARENRIRVAALPIQNTGQLRALLNAAVAEPGGRKAIVSREAARRVAKQDPTAVGGAAADRVGRDGRRGRDPQRNADRVVMDGPRGGVDRAPGGGAGFSPPSESTRMFNR